MKTWAIPVITAITLLLSFSMISAYAATSADFLCTYIDAKKFDRIICPQTPEVGDIIEFRHPPRYFEDCNAEILAVTPETGRTGTIGAVPVPAEPGNACVRAVFLLDYQVTGKP